MITNTRAGGELARGIGMGLLFGAISLVLMLVLTPIVGTVIPPLASWVVLLIWMVNPILAGYFTSIRLEGALAAGAVSASFVVAPMLAMQGLRFIVFAIKAGFTDANFTGQRISVLLTIAGAAIAVAVLGLILGWVGFFLHRYRPAVHP